MTRRSIPEWIGASPDAAIPPRVKLRILERQDRKCGLTGCPIPPGIAPDYDHKIALRDGGEHRETNLHAVMPDAHRKKTAREAKERAKIDAKIKLSHGLSAPSKPIEGKPFPLGKRRLKNPTPDLPRRSLFA